MKKKKTFNPFKMAGSWIGAILYALPLMIFLNTNSVYNSWSIFNTIYFIPMKISQLCNSGGMNCISFALYSLIISIPIIGFLIGWGMHSLIRKLTKGKV